MTESSKLSVYEKAFVKSGKTDAILVVQGKKLHVNKAVLSYHSDYFDVLFNSDFKEKSMKEIEIKDVVYKDFTLCLSIVLHSPMKLEANEVEPLLSIADRFQIPAAKRHLEQVLLTTYRTTKDLLILADKYKLDAVMNHALSESGSRQSYLCINKNEKTFAKTDKSDAILGVDGKKLHVNKAVLSYHSDYFSALFNSEFTEKSMEEIEIKDVRFNDFSALLSLAQINPIPPTDENAERILELADRFQLHIAKRHVELFLPHSNIDNLEKVRIGEKYEMEDLLEFGVEHLERAHFRNLPEKAVFKEFSSKTKNKLFYRYLRI